MLVCVCSPESTDNSVSTRVTVENNVRIITISPCTIGFVVIGDTADSIADHVSVGVNRGTAGG